MAAVAGERAPVGGDHAADQVLHRVAFHELVDRDDQRRIADDPCPAVDDLGELAGGPQAVLRARFRDVAIQALQLLRAPAPGPEPRQVVDVDPGVPEVERPHLGERAHRRAIVPRDGQVDPLALGRVELAIAPGDREARDEALDVPLERAGQRLVEVVEAEDQPPVGSGERPEVRQVRVAAQLRVQRRARAVREIGRHQAGGAAVERERRRQHSPVTDRKQLLQPRLLLLLEECHRIVPVGGRPEARVRGPRRLGARGLADGRTLRLRQMPDSPPGCGAHRESPCSRPSTMTPFVSLRPGGRITRSGRDRSVATTSSAPNRTRIAAT